MDVDKVQGTLAIHKVTFFSCVGEALEQISRFFLLLSNTLYSPVFALCSKMATQVFVASLMLHGNLALVTCSDMVFGLSWVNE